jgi:hypothetical protein
VFHLLLQIISILDPPASAPFQPVRNESSYRPMTDHLPDQGCGDGVQVELPQVVGEIRTGGGEGGEHSFINLLDGGCVVYSDFYVWN